MIMKLIIRQQKNEDVLANQFVLDATFLGEYTDETLTIIKRLVALNNGAFRVDLEDLEIMKKLLS